MYHELQHASRLISIQSINPTCVKKTYLNATDGQTDRQTEGQTTYFGITALLERSIER